MIKELKTVNFVCDLHPDQCLIYFCITDKKFLCTECNKNEHKGHSKAKIKERCVDTYLEKALSFLIELQSKVGNHIEELRRIQKEQMSVTPK